MLDLLKWQLLATENRLVRSPQKPDERVALFDLDGTLLIGDIGDAVFAYLILEGHRLPLSWKEYQRLLRSHKSKAYCSVVEAMSGLETETLVRATIAVMNFKSENLVIGADLVSIPKPRPLLSQFLLLLREFQYQIYVISASNHISVQRVAAEWFNIPPTHAFGIQARTCEGRFTSDLLHPIPVGPGKTEVFKLAAGPAIPLITGSDSAQDLPMLRLTHPAGFSLWVGENKREFEVVVENIRPGQKLFFAGSGEEARSDEF
jgi:phosphoserine phosphatase